MPFQKGNQLWKLGDTLEKRRKQSKKMKVNNPMKKKENAKTVSEKIKDRWDDPSSIYHTDEYKEKMTKRKNHSIQHTAEARMKISQSRVGKYHSDKNPAWKGGKPEWWRLKLIDVYNNCSLCHSDYKLELHHRDEDREHNERSNFFMLCKNCHDFWHKN